MNHASDRASPGGSTAFSRHCSMRCVLCERAFLFGVTRRWKKKTSVSISSVFNSSRSISGESRQNVAGFDFDHLANDQPFQFRQRRSLRTWSLPPRPLGSGPS